MTTTALFVEILVVGAITALWLTAILVSFQRLFIREPMRTTFRFVIPIEAPSPDPGDWRNWLDETIPQFFSRFCAQLKSFPLPNRDTGHSLGKVPARAGSGWCADHGRHVGSDGLSSA